MKCHGGNLGKKWEFRKKNISELCHGLLEHGRNIVGVSWARVHQTLEKSCITHKMIIQALCLSMTFLPKNYNLSLIIKKTPDKSQLRYTLYKISHQYSSELGESGKLSKSRGA